MATKRHVAEDNALVGSVLGNTNGTSKIGDSTHRYAEVNIATGGFLDYATSLQFKKAGANSIRIEADARITGVTDPSGTQDVATKNYVDTQIGGENFWDRSGSTISQYNVGDELHLVGTLGAEIVPALTDGNWVVGAGWEDPIAGGVLNKNADGSGTMVPNTGTVVLDKTYKIVLTFSAFTSGTCYMNFGADVTSVITTGGTHTFYNTTLSTQKLTLYGSSTSRFTISSASAKEISGADLIVEGISYLEGGIKPLIIWNDAGNKFARLSVANDGEISSNSGFSSTSTGETAGFRSYMFRGANSQSFLDFYRGGWNVGFRAYIGSDHPDADQTAYVFENESSGVGRLTAISGHQTFLAINPRIAQSGTAVYTGLEINVTEDSIGGSASYLLDVQRNSSSVFSVTRGGELKNAAGNWIKCGFGIDFYNNDAGGTNSSVLYFDSNNDEALHMVLRGDSKNFIICGTYYQNYDRGVSTNPTLYVFSNTAPNTANDEWVSLSHNQTDGIIGLGSGVLELPATKVNGNIGFFNTTPVSKTAVTDQSAWASISSGAQLVDMSDLNTKVQAIRDKLQSTIDALQSYGII